MQSDDSSRDALLGGLADEFVERHRLGECPPLSEYVDRYPHLAQDIRELFPALVHLEELKPSPVEINGYPGKGSAVLPERLGEYRILREIGRGGMGVVYEAEQESLGRHVALKVLPTHAVLGGTYLERFRREARAAAKLHHTNIVPVFGVGEAEGVHFYAMQFIRGDSLDTVLASLRRFRTKEDVSTASASIARSLLTGQFTPPSDLTGDAEMGSSGVQPTAGSDQSGLIRTESGSAYYRSVARLGKQVADALAHAHARGILHRDIKPSNLLLDAQGRVWITDFGLARAEGSEDLTNDGDVVGTVRYLAPERFNGESLPQSDIWALGLTLYELVTLKPVFSDPLKAQLIDKILHEPIRSPRHHDPHLPRDLETILLKCLAKDPGERYTSAAALAEDLDRFVSDQPILARRITSAERLWRWCRRSPLVAGLSAAVLLLVVLTAVGGIVMSLRLDDMLRKTQKAEQDGQRKLFLSYISDANATRMTGRPGQRFKSLQKIREALAIGARIGMSDEEKRELRNVAIAAFCLPDMEPQSVPIGEVTLPVLEDMDSGLRRKVLALKAHSRLPIRAHGVRGETWFSPDGKYIVAATMEYDKRLAVPVGVWRVDREKPEPILEDPIGPYEDATAFSPDSRQVVFGHEDGTVRFHDLETKKVVRQLPAGAGPVFTLAFHPVLPRLAVACGSEVTIWDLPTQKPLVRLPHRGQVCAIAWHPRGHRLVTGSHPNHIDLWNAETATRITETWKGHRLGGIRLAFNRSGDRVSSTDWANTQRLWDAVTGEQLLRTSGVGALRFSADDRSLGVYPTETTLDSFRVETGKELRTLIRSTPRGLERLLGWDLHPGGRLVVAKSETGIVFFDLHTREEIGFFPGRFARAVQFDSTGAMWISGVAGLFRWPVVVSADSSHYRIGPPEWIADMVNTIDPYRTSSDGTVVGVPKFNDGAMLVHPASPRRVLHIGPQHDTRHVFLSPDGLWAVTASHFKDINEDCMKLWDAQKGRLVTNLPLGVRYESFGGFSPDSRWLYLTQKGGQRLEIASLLANPDSVPLREEIRSSPSVRSTWNTQQVNLGGLISPDNRMKAYGGDDGSIRLVDSETEEEFARLNSSEPGQISPTRFSPDGSLLLAHGWQSDRMYIFDLRRIREQLSELGLDWPSPQPVPARLDAAPVSQISLEIVGGESARTLWAMARYEVNRSVATLSANPRDPVAHFRIGARLLQLGNPGGASHHLATASALQPDLDEVMYLRAVALFRLERFEEAREEITHYLEKVPFDTPGRRLRAKIHEALNCYTDAIADYTSLLKTYPTAAEYYESRAGCYERLKQADSAKADREKARKFGSDDTIQLQNEAWRLTTGPTPTRDPVRAADLIRRAMEQRPDDAIMLNTLGVVQYRNGKYAEAIATLEKSLAITKGETAAFDLYFQAMAHARRGDKAKAEDCFKRALKWVEEQETLPASWLEELSRFRLEAAAEIRKMSSP